MFVWSFFSNNIPWQYIAIRIVIRLSCIAIYRNTLLPYRDTPTTHSHYATAKLYLKRGTDVVQYTKSSPLPKTKQKTNLQPQRNLRITTVLTIKTQLPTQYNEAHQKFVVKSFLCLQEQTTECCIPLPHHPSLVLNFYWSTKLLTTAI